jgi:glucokinase
MRGHSGFAAEFGHMVVVQDGRPCGRGGLGCWEQYVSGRALLRAYGELAGLQDGEMPPGSEVTALARGGDAAALGAFAAVGDSLGRGMAMLTAALDPDLFVVGGGVADAGELLLGPTRRAYATGVAPHSRFRPPARISVGELGGEAGVIGAADLARRHAQGGRHHGR